MDALPTATHPSPDAAQPSEASYFECPKCQRQCKSRTWFLKHLETCFKGPSYLDSSSIVSSPVPASGETTTGPSPAQQQLQHHHHRAPRSTGADDAPFLPVFEWIGTSPSSSSVRSYQDLQSRRNSKPKLGVSGGGESDVPQDTSDSRATSPNAGSLRAAALAFSFKHLHGSDAGQHGSTAKLPYGNADDASVKAFHARHPSNGATHSPSNPGADGSGLPPGLSQPTSILQTSSSYLCSPLGLRTATGESGSTGFSHQHSPVAPAAASPAAALASSHYGGGVGSMEEVSPRQLPVRQGSFRLHSDGTWTQYTPTTSSASSSDEDGNGGGNNYAGVRGADSFLAHSGRRSSSQSLSRNGGQGASQANHKPPHHHHSTNGNSSNTSAHGRLMYGRDTGSLSFNAGSRLVSPAGLDALSEPWVHERNGSVGSNRNESVAGAASSVGASQARQSSLSFAAMASLPREQERLVPRLMTNAIGDQTPLDRKGSGVNFGGETAAAGDRNDRLSRSAHGSASPGTLSRMSSSASPMFAQAMASPTLPHMSASLPNGASGSRLSGVNGGSYTSGSRTPRQNDRSGAVTPRTISFQRGRAVGSGGFGTVYQAVLSDGSLAAVKELKLENTNLKAIDREVRAMSGIPPHPNCVRYLGSRYSAHHYYIIMEYISGGSINSLRKSVGRFRESVFQRYAYMVLLGLAHLHAHGIVHRDIKGANVLLDESGCAKIVDFGCSRDVNQATTTLSGGGTPLWMAPEVCRGEPATEKSDVWSFGCLCLEMTNDSGLPWNFPANITLQGVVYALACAKTSPPIPSDLSPEAQDFLQQCLRVDADERATVTQLLQHPFFDVDLMEDSDEDEMLSSCPQSAVKRVVKEVQRGHIADAQAAAAAPSGDNDDFASGHDGDNEARDSPLLPGLVIGERSPRTSLQEQRNRNDSSSNTGNEGDMIVVSQSTHSKSPSGPRLDHYPRSVNVGFSLQAVNDEDNEEGNDGKGNTNNNNTSSNNNSNASSAGLQPPPQPQSVPAQVEEPSAFGKSNEADSGPPVLPSTSVPANRLHTPSMGSVANLEDEDEDEYTQMITEIITQAREAYTDEERRMTERRRRRNDLHPSSDDDDDDSFSNTSGASAEGHAAPNLRRHVHSASGASTDITSSDDDDDEDDDDSGDRGGPQRHKLGTTWRDVFNSSSPVIPVNQDGPLRGGNEEGAKVRGTAAGVDVKVAKKQSSSLSTQAPPTAPPDNAAAEGNGVRASGRKATSSVLLSAKTHADPQSPSLSSPSNRQLPVSSSSLSPASHCPLPRQNTPTSPPPPSSVFREAAPREMVRDTCPAATAMTPPKGVVAGSSGTSLSPSEPGGPGRSSAASQTHQRLSPSFLPLSQTPSPAVNAVTTSAERSRSPRTPQSTPSLTVGGPSRQSSQGPWTAIEATSLCHSPNSTPIEWYTGGSGRLKRNVTWQTSGSAEQPKGLSMAQKEMQDMLDWGSRGSDCHSSTASSTSPAMAKRGSKDLRSDLVSDAQAAAHCHGYSHHHHHHHHHEKEESQSPTAAAPVKSLSATEKVEAKRRHLGLGLFRSRKSK
ncbi:protein kinase [Lotmaria passim]